MVSLMEIENTGASFRIQLSANMYAELEYHIEGGRIYLDSTYTPEEFRGRGLGAALVEEVVSFAKKKKLKIVPICPFAVEYFKKHPEHNDILSQ